MKYVIVTLKDKKTGIKAYGVDSLKLNSIQRYREILKHVFLERHPEISIENIIFISKEKYEEVKETSLSVALYTLMVMRERKEKEIRKKAFKNFFKNIFKKERSDKDVY